jgi:hypothetical protein
MADRPIIFSAPMVRALLEGRKTQTRRIIKLQPELNDAGLWVWPPSSAKISKRTWRGFCQTDEEGLKSFFDAPGKAQEALPAKVGDRMWVRESFDPASEPGDVYYRADYDAMYPGGSDLLGWRPSIFMPRCYSRMTLTVTEVRVQRLQEINEEDAIAEGWPGPVTEVGFPIINPGGWFQGIWWIIHGVESWEANPWVAAISFTVEQRNIDAEAK